MPGICVRRCILALFVGKLKYGDSRVSILLVKENAPTPDSLGATNGLVLFAMCLTRSFCPALVRYVDNQRQWLYRGSMSDARIPVACSFRRWREVKSSGVISGLSFWQPYRMPAPYLGSRLSVVDDHPLIVSQVSRAGC